MPLITVLTPTYNRAHTLPALRASLAAQTFHDFEWLVIDDGSTDATGELLASWATDESLAPRVIQQVNGGKHRALNRGIPEARGLWTFIVDSDDRLPADALSRIASVIDHIADTSELCGIMGLKGGFDGRVIGGFLPKGVKAVDTATLTFVYGIRGDKAEVFLTDVLKRYPFPEFEGERFLTEALVWNRMARDGRKFHLLNEVIYLCEYRDDGLSAKSLELRLRNPRGNLLYYQEELLLPYPAWKLVREAANWVRFALRAGGFSARYCDLPRRARCVVWLAFPIGLFAYVGDGVKLWSRR